jgi:tetratricopeptide (TPR) repeat protein
MRLQLFSGDKNGTNAFNLADSFLHTGDLDKAASMQSLAFESLALEGNKEGIAKYHGNMARIARCQKDYSAALTFHGDEQDAARALNNNEILAGSLYNQSITLRRMGNLPEAHAKARESTKVAIQSKSPRWIAVSNIEELFMRVISGQKEKKLFGFASKPLDLPSIITQVQTHLATIDGNFALGHWLGSAYLAILLKRNGEHDCAEALWNDTLSKAQTNGFKLIEWEMEALVEGGWWK